MFQRILVPIDGSEASNKGLEEAIKLAADSGATLRLLHVVNELILLGAQGPSLYLEDLMAPLRKRAQEVLATAKQRVEERSVKVEVIMRETLGGRAGDCIVDEAKRWPAELIVMGTHGRKGLDRLALGSDAERVLRHATVPVMTVRESAG